MRRWLVLGGALLVAACCKSTPGTGATSGSGGSTSGASSGSASTGGGGTASGGSSGGGTGQVDAGSQYGPHQTPVTVASLDGGAGAGLDELPDGGGVVLGTVANFKSHFAYQANSGQNADTSFVSRVDTDTGLELARYPSVVPVDNGGRPLCDAGQPTTCLVDVTSTFYDNAPSRTVVDLNGGVFVANRGQCDWYACTPGNGKYLGPGDPGGNANGVFVQGSVTYIANFVDHPEQCAPRCKNRLGWALPDGSPAPFTSGYALPLKDGGVATISPHEALLPGAGQQYAPDVWAHPCQDGFAHDPSDVTDLTNYDDCAQFTVPVGSPNGYDLPLEQTAGLGQDRFAPRGLAISKNCGGFEGPGQLCDVYVGLTEPHTETAYLLHLGHGSNFSVTNVIDTGLTSYGMYGAAIDCEGVLWGTQEAGPARVGVDTDTDKIVSQWQYVDGNGQTQTMPDVAEFGGKCLGYGIAVDLEQRVWTGLLPASGNSMSGACAFDYRAFQAQAALQPGGAGALPQAQAQALMETDWKAFPFYNVFPSGNGRGIVADVNGVVYLAVSDNGFNAGSIPGLIAFTYDGSGSACGANGDSPCLWAFQGASGVPYGAGSIGVDLDQDGNPWVAQRGGTNPGVVGLTAATGQPLPPFAAGDTPLAGPTDPGDVYSYSDFTGYALRKITQPAGAYQQVFAGCPSPTETEWQGLGYGAVIPAGTDIAFEVDVADDPSAFTGGGAPILGSWTCASAATCPSVASLASAALPATQYARVTARLSGPSCTESGLSPTLRWLQLDYDCPAPNFH
ncbi:MAG TPA: hypothetical protein VMB50_04615 [Myxococcales bacterium]|nr:hypothetical protein [Myxococcales bacterium]